MVVYFKCHGYEMKSHDGIPMTKYRFLDNGANHQSQCTVQWVGPTATPRAHSCSFQARQWDNCKPTTALDSIQDPRRNIEYTTRTTSFPIAIARPYYFKNTQWPGHLPPSTPQPPNRAGRSEMRNDAFNFHTETTSTSPDFLTAKTASCTDTLWQDG